MGKKSHKGKKHKGSIWHGIELLLAAAADKPEKGKQKEDRALATTWMSALIGPPGPVRSGGPRGVALSDAPGPVRSGGPRGRRFHKSNNDDPKHQHGQPRDKTYLSIAELRALITAQLGARMSAGCSMFLSDEAYYCPPMADVEEIVSNSLLDRVSYVEDTYDCDDFALVLKGHFAQAAYAEGKRRKPHCVGLLWGVFGTKNPINHALNWVVTDDLILRLIEPQTGDIWEPRKSDQGISFMLG